MFEPLYNEGDCRVLLGRLIRAQMKENAFRGDPDSNEANQLMAATAKAERDCITVMHGGELPRGWHNGTERNPA